MNRISYDKLLDEWSESQLEKVNKYRDKSSKSLVTDEDICKVFVECRPNMSFYAFRMALNPLLNKSKKNGMYGGYEKGISEALTSLNSMETNEIKNFTKS